MQIRFNKAYCSGKELEYIAQACASGKLSGGGTFTNRCEDLLSHLTACKKALLVHSCTAALEMAAILINTQSGDEIIMPSYTFVSTANAFVLRGAIPVFVDIRPDTLNINEALIEAAITPKTKAIVAVHYAGVGCEMDAILNIARKHSLYVIEDAAQAIQSSYQNKSLGSFGHLAALSFHDTKNIISGEGGALLINDSQFIEKAEILREKGTNRSRFFRGEVDKYTWVDVGSSFLPSELNAAYLLAQLEQAENITKQRMHIWELYHQAFLPLEQANTAIRPTIPKNCQHNAHMYYLILKNLAHRSAFIESLKTKDIYAVFHYTPLHSSPAGKMYGKTASDMTVTNKISENLVRLPLWIGLEEHIEDVIHEIKGCLQDT
jgi:dTDP-4-amino-4,6-dideoxygalactose transaminase